MTLKLFEWTMERKKNPTTAVMSVICLSNVIVWAWTFFHKLLIFPKFGSQHLCWRHVSIVAAASHGIWQRVWSLMELNHQSEAVEVLLTLLSSQKSTFKENYMWHWSTFHPHGIHNIPSSTSVTLVNLHRACTVILKYVLSSLFYLCSLAGMNIALSIVL